MQHVQDGSGSGSGAASPVSPSAARQHDHSFGYGRYSESERDDIGYGNVDQVGPETLCFRAEFSAMIYFYKNVLQLNFYRNILISALDLRSYTTKTATTSTIPSPSRSCV